MQLLECLNIYATSEPLNFLKITPSYNIPINKKFSKNWLEYLNPREFESNIMKQIKEESREESDEEEEEEEEYEPIVSKRKYTNKK